MNDIAVNATAIGGNLSRGRMSLPITIDQDHPAATHSNNNFTRYRFETTNVPDLVRFVHRHRDKVSPAELLPIIEVLNSRTIGAFETLGSLHAYCHGGNSAPSPGCIKAMRNLVLESVDRRLQKLYRDHLRACPPAPETPHEQKIASLEATRNEVLWVLNTYDWYWLADWLELSRIGESAASCVQRLANFAFPIKRVNFRFTYHCNIACRHCYNDSGPHRKADRLALETMLAIVAEMPEVGIKRLNLSGGEPFLYQDDLIALVAAGRAAGLERITIYTNGFWASTDERAMRVLNRLSASGFMRSPRDHIKVSGGVYHQEFIAFERILTLARNYFARFGRRLEVDFELPPQRGKVADEVRARFSAAGLTEQVTLSFRHIVSLGRGENVEGMPIRLTDSPPCAIMNEIAFDPDGSARPCCSGNGEHHGIVIGRLEQHRLKTLAKRMQNDPILQFIATHSMSKIFDFIPTATKKDGYSGRCDLCMDALGGVTDKEPLQAALFDRQKFYPFWFRLSAKPSQAGRASPN
jgi:organic radical activating enzyme